MSDRKAERQLQELRVQIAAWCGADQAYADGLISAWKADTLEEAIAREAQDCIDNARRLEKRYGKL